MRHALEGEGSIPSDATSMEEEESVVAVMSEGAVAALEDVAGTCWGGGDRDRKRGKDGSLLKNSRTGLGMLRLLWR